MQSQRCILEWCDKIINVGIKETTELIDLRFLIADRRQLLFGHICRLSRDTPVSQALHLSIGVFTGIPPAADWKCPPGRPRRTWLQQVEEDMGLPFVSFNGPLVVAIAMTLSLSSAAVSERVISLAITYMINVSSRCCTNGL